MKKELLALSAVSMLTTFELSARRLLCEDCEPEPEVCDEHLFVERSQIFISGEFLYWTVEENALDYSIRMNESTDAITTFALGDYQIAKYDWKPGVRASLSYYRCPRYWEVTGQYTWYHGKGTNSAARPAEQNRFMNPTRDTLNDGPFSNSTSSIEVDYQIGDAYVARIFDPNPHLRIRLIGGLTAAYIDRDWDVSYTTSVGTIETEKTDWRYFGGGIRMGLTADWFWGCQFYFTGRTTFATLIGDFKNTIHRSESVEGSIGDAKYEDHRFAFHAQFLLGPSWQLPCDCYSFEVFAGYEFNVWVNVAETIRCDSSYADDPKISRYANGLFGLHGLTVRATFGF